MGNKDITENTAKLLNLVRRHPNLPIVPIVWSEVVSDDGYAYWLGKFGNIEVGEYAVYRERLYTDKDEFKEVYYRHNDDELCEKFDYEPSISKYAVTKRKYTQQ